MSIGPPPRNPAEAPTRLDAAQAQEADRVDLPSAPQPGHVIAGKYAIECLLAHGGMGVVMAGRQLALDRPVAIKFLRRRCAAGSLAMQRFEREARSIAKMQSTHVVRVFDVGVEDGVPFIVMERLIGNDLATELERERRLAPELASEYLLEACEAVAEAHSLGIVHRDLKPSNLFLADGLGGRRLLKVLDFGVSKWLHSDPTESSIVTADSAFVGTPGYLSPEQLAAPDAIDERTDIWALGVVLYELLTGQRPFDTSDLARSCARILSAEPNPFPDSVALPPRLREVVLCCLAKSPGQRYPNVAALAQSLAGFASPRARPLVESIASLGSPRREPRPESTLTRAASELDPRQGSTAGLTKDTGRRQAAATRGARPRIWLSVLVGLTGLLVVLQRLRWEQAGAPDAHSSVPASSGPRATLAALPSAASPAWSTQAPGPGPSQSAPPPSSTVPTHPPSPPAHRVARPEAAPASTGSAPEASRASTVASVETPSTVGSQKPGGTSTAPLRDFDPDKLYRR